MASCPKKTAVALATILTCLVTSTDAVHSHSHNSGQTRAAQYDASNANQAGMDPIVGSLAPGNHNMSIVDPMKMQSMMDSKEAEKEKENGKVPPGQVSNPTGTKYENTKKDDALKQVKNEEPVTGTPKPVESNLGPAGAVEDASTIKEKQETSSAQTTLAQTYSMTSVADQESIDQIVEDLAPHVSGGTEQAREIVANILQELQKTYSEDQILQVLRIQVQNIKASADEQEQASVKAETEADVQTVNVNGTPDSANLNQVGGSVETNPQPSSTQKAPSKKHTQNFPEDMKVKMKPGQYEEEIRKQQNAANPVTDEKAVPNMDQKRQQQVKYEPSYHYRETHYQNPMLKKNYQKIAQRSRAWLQAMNEQAIIEPRSVFVEKAMTNTEIMIERDMLGEIKPKYRAPHVFADDEVEYMLELLAEAVYETVGKDRTAAFDLMKILPLYPASRIHFDYDGIVFNERFDNTIDDMANQKAHYLMLARVSDTIVQNLSEPDGKMEAEEGVTIGDWHKRTFLESMKSTDPDKLSSEILDSYTRIVSERSQSIADSVINKSFDSVDRTASMITDDVAEIKSDFALYQTFMYLQDDKTSSIELISQNVALEQSAIASRFTHTLVNQNLYDVSIPTGTSQLIGQFENDKVQKKWYDLTSGSL